MNVAVNVALTFAAFGIIGGVCWALDGILRLIKPPTRGRHAHPAGARARWRDHPTSQRVSGSVAGMVQWAREKRQAEAFATYPEAGP